MALMMAAFRELSTTRNRQMSDVGMIVGPIPWDKIATYLDYMGFDPINGEVAHYAIRALDDEYLSMERKRLETEAEKRRQELKRASKGRR